MMTYRKALKGWSSVILAMALLLVAVSAAACSNPDAAQDGDTVRVEYQGTLSDGTVFDSTLNESFGHPDPLEFTIGAGQMIPGFDNAVRGMDVGDTKTVTIKAKDAYGEKYFEVLLSELPDDLMEGEELLNQADNTVAIVFNISGDMATLESTNELAGEDLTFEIEMVEIIKPAGTE
jgi:peptidylprolyl isomerase